MLVIDPRQQVDELIARRDLKKAEVVIARALKAEPHPADRAVLLISRARVRLISGRFDDALVDLTTASGLHPAADDDPAVVELHGDVHFARFELSSVGFADRADTAQALAAYERILTEFPTYDNLGWIYYQKGRILLTANRVTEAANCFQVGMLNPSRVAPLTAYCYERLGFIAFYEQRDPRQALDFLTKAIVTYPAAEPRLWLSNVHALQSRVHREMRQLDQSLTAAKAAIAVAASAGHDGRPGLADALLTAAEAASEIDGAERDVIAYLNQFLQVTKKPVGIDVTRSRVYEILGDALLKTRQYAAAARAYQGALQVNPYHPWEQALYYRMARAYYLLRDYPAAIRAIERMVKAAHADGQQVTDYRVYTVLGHAHYALEQYAEAETAYATALTIAPPTAESLPTLREYLGYAQTMARKRR